MNIAVLMGGLLYDSQRELLAGIADYAKEAGANVFVFTCGGDIYKVNNHNKGEFQIYSLPDFCSYDGIIIAPNTIQNIQVVKELEKKIRKLHIPTAVIDAEMQNFVNFVVDNEKAMYDMGEHIVKCHKCRKILYISGPKENQESNERKRGFLSCMEKNRLEKDKDFCIMYGNFWTDSGEKLLQKYIKQQKSVPEAVICANDYMAIGVIEELNRMGIRVPDEVVVTGFDDSKEARYHEPRITSIKKPIYGIGYAACKDLLDGNIGGGTRRFSVDYKFTESCGCMKCSKEDIKEFKKKVTRERNDNIYWAEILNAMSADLNELSMPSEFIDKLKKYIRKLGFPYFYLCLCDESLPAEQVELIDGRYRIVNQENKTYTDRMQVEIAYANGKFHAPEKIETNKLLPQSFYKNAEGVVAVILPIHFRLHNMGYCVVGDSSFPMETIQFQSWITSLGNGLENIRKQMLMKFMIEQLNKMWICDSMTGVLNRTGFYQKAEEIIGFCKKQQLPVRLSFVDIDRLKNVNDSYGHEEGDFYIKSVARVLQDNCDAEGIVMRYGGDEFVILQCDEGKEPYDRLTRRIKKAVADIRKEQNKPYIMDVSIGHYVEEVTENFNLEVLLEQADKEMYEMKRKVIR